MVVVAAVVTIHSKSDPDRRSLRVHHTNDGFQNPHLIGSEDSKRGFSDFLKWQFDRGPVEELPVPPKDIPRYRPVYANPDLAAINSPDSNRITVTWIGHASFLVQVGGVNILTDPIFSDRCSPVSFAGPKRVPRPGLAFDELPEIDVVLISHDHYDHLDKETIRKLGNEPKYFVPLKIRSWLRDQDITNVIEKDWWGSEGYGGLTFHCVPTQHFSGRTLTGRNKTLWCGWVIESRAGNIFFAGDTGYSPDFQEIGRRFKKMRLSMIPIGAYRPRWFMGPVHVDPPSAIKIHLDVRSELSVAMHWGTFNLAEESLGEPPIYLERTLKAEELSEDAFVTMEFGETRVLQPGNE